MRSKRLRMVAIALGVVLTFFLFAWRWMAAKHGPAKTIAAVAVTDGIVLHQRAEGIASRGPMAQDRLVAIYGRTGHELVRANVLRGELLGTRGDAAVYAIGTTMVLYEGTTLKSSPAGQMAPLTPMTRYGALVDIGDAILLLDSDPVTGNARVSRLTKPDRSQVWSNSLPWSGHDTKLVAVFSQIVVLVDADGTAGLDRMNGEISWLAH